MPPNEGVWTHTRQQLAPLDEWQQHDERDTRRMVHAPRLDLSLDVACELLSQEEVLGRQLRAGTKHQLQQAQ
jgi:hypothetical protein